MENIKNYLQVIPIIIILASCSSASKLRRAEKLIKRAEAAGATWKIDTLFIDKEVIVPEIRLDSIVVVKLGDTVRLEREKLRIKVVRMPGDTVFVDAACLPDTVKITVPVTVTKEIVVHGALRWYHILMWSLIALLVGIFFGRVILKLLI